MNNNSCVPKAGNLFPVLPPFLNLDTGQDYNFKAANLSDGNPLLSGKFSVSNILKTCLADLNFGYCLLNIRVG